MCYSKLNIKVPYEPSISIFCGLIFIFPDVVVGVVFSIVVGDAVLVSVIEAVLLMVRLLSEAHGHGSITLTDSHGALG